MGVRVPLLWFALFAVLDRVLAFCVLPTWVIVPAFLYTAYGLSVCSEFPFPELGVGSPPADVFVRLGPAPPSKTHLLDGGGPISMAFDTLTEEAYLTEEAIGSFHVRKGSEIIVTPAPDVSFALLRSALLRHAMGLVLLQRGHLVLHANAVAVAGRAVAFLGEPGAGKSTMTAEMHRRGHPLVADDVLSLHLRGAGDPLRGAGDPMVDPSYPQMRLRPDTATFFEDHLGNAAPLLGPKHAYENVSFWPHPLPLGCLYLLEAGERLLIERLSPRAAAVEMVRHAYIASALGKMEIEASHLRQCAILANRVPVYRLTRPRLLSSLPAVAMQIEEESVRSYPLTSSTPATQPVGSNLRSQPTQSSRPPA